MTLEILLALMVGASVNPVTAAGLLAGGITTVGGGIISNRADAALVWSCQSLAKVLKHQEVTSLRETLGKALWLSYLQALKSVCTECKAELIGKIDRLEQRTWRGRAMYPAVMQSDIQWLDGKLHQLSQQIGAIEQGKLDPVPDFSWQALESFAAPTTEPMAKWAAAQATQQTAAHRQSLKRAALSALVKAADEPGIVTLYKSKLEDTETGLFERVCGFFAKQLMKDAVLRIFFQNQLLMQISGGLAEQAITLDAVQQKLNDLSQTVPQQLNQALSQLEAIETKQEVTQDYALLIVEQTQSIKKQIEMLIVAQLEGQQLSEISAGEAADVDESNLATTIVSAPNPFGPLGGRIDDPEQFFGQALILSRIFEILNSGSSVAMIGKPQMGKSSLLKMIQRQAIERLEVSRDALYMDLQHILDEDDFYYELCMQVGIEKTQGARLFRALRPKRLLLLLDGLERMTLDGFSDGVRRHLRGLAEGKDAPIQMVVAASEDLDILFAKNSGTSPVEGICLPEIIKPWDENTIRQFIDNRLQKTSIQFSEADIVQIIDDSNGHPRQVILHCYRCYERYEEKP